ncbi:hypothetical protein EWB00_006420, partial [Schistosoma japonicum]
AFYFLQQEIDFLGYYYVPIKKWEKETSILKNTRKKSIILVTLRERKRKVKNTVLKTIINLVQENVLHHHQTLTTKRSNCHQYDKNVTLIQFICLVFIFI